MAIPGESHTFVVAIDSQTGSMYATRGGPGSGANSSMSTSLFKLVAVSGPFDANFTDQLSSVSAFQFVGSVDLPFDQVATRMDQFAAVTNANPVVYSGYTNSNSYSFTFLHSLGLPRPSPIQNALGSGTGSVAPALQCHAQ